jgi:hypothetical protein
LDSDGVSVWLQKQLKPVTKSLEKVPPETFSWVSLALAAGAGALLYFAQAQYYPIAALPAALLLLLRLMSDSVEEILCAQADPNKVYNRFLIRLCARLADLSMLLGFAFWDSLRIHLVLLAIVSMLLVSYAGELGRAVGREEAVGGLLCKANRIILLIFFCIIYLLMPNSHVGAYSVFEVMFVLFIPLASITLLQRMDSSLSRPPDD